MSSVHASLVWSMTKVRLCQTPEELKTPTAEEAFNPDGLVQRSIRLLKDRFPDLEVHT